MTALSIPNMNEAGPASLGTAGSQRHRGQSGWAFLSPPNRIARVSFASSSSISIKSICWSLQRDPRHIHIPSTHQTRYTAPPLPNIESAHARACPLLHSTHSRHSAYLPSLSPPTAHMPLTKPGPSSGRNSGRNSPAHSGKGSHSGFHPFGGRVSKHFGDMVGTRPTASKSGQAI